MPKNKKRRSLKQKRPRGKKSGPVFTRFESPFKDMPSKELIRGLVKTGKSYESEFRESLDELKFHIQASNPLHLLSVLSKYGLTTGMTESGKTTHKGPDSFSQSHAELAQALALQIPVKELSPEPTAPQKVQEVWDLLLSTSNAFTMKRFVQVEKAETKEEKALLGLQERIRAHTQHVRNWGYLKQVIDISKRLFGPLDSLYKSELGLTATEIISVFKFLVRRFDTQVNEHTQTLRPVIQAKTTKQALESYIRAFPDVKLGGFEAFISEHNIPLDGVKSLLMSHSDLRLPEQFTFSCDELAQHIHVDPANIHRALSQLSFRFGALKGEDSENFFLLNPIWVKPLIQLEDGSFFCPLPMVFFSFIFQIMGNLVHQNTQILNALSKRRAEFLEDEVEAQIKEAFPKCECVRNIKWRADGTEYETDLLAKIDSYALVVEAKSGAISWPALRGAPDRLKRHIQDILAHPSQQSKRFTDKLMGLKLGEESDQEFLLSLPFKIDDLQSTIRLSITLEDFATIQSNISALKGSGTIPSDIRVAPTMTLADMGIVFDILDGTPEKLHYLIRRAEIENHMEYFGDELDLLGLYLDTAFNLGEVEFQDGPMIFNQMSQKVDEYFIALDQNISRRKPKLKSTRWWTNIGKRIEDRHPSRWSEAAVMLLNVAYEEQRKIERRFKIVIKNVKKTWRKPGHLNSVILMPPAWRQDAFALMAFRDRMKGERHKYMENLASSIFSESHAQRCLILGVNIDREEYPYSILGVMDRPSDSD